MSVGSILPGVQGTATYGTDSHNGPDIKLGPKTLAGMSKAQLLEIARDTKGKYDVNTQIEAAKRLGDPKLKMTWTDSDLKNVSPLVLGYLSVSGSKDLKDQIPRFTTNFTAYEHSQYVQGVTMAYQQRNPDNARN